MGKGHSEASQKANKHAQLAKVIKSQHACVTKAAGASRCVDSAKSSSIGDTSLSTVSATLPSQTRGPKTLRNMDKVIAPISSLGAPSLSWSQYPYKTMAPDVLRLGQMERVSVSSSAWAPLKPTSTPKSCLRKTYGGAKKKISWSPCLSKVTAVKSMRSNTELWWERPNHITSCSSCQALISLTCAYRVSAGKTQFSDLAVYCELCRTRAPPPEPPSLQGLYAGMRAWRAKCG